MAGQEEERRYGAFKVTRLFPDQESSPSFSADAAVPASKEKNFRFSHVVVAPHSGSSSSEGKSRPIEPVWP